MQHSFLLFGCLLTLSLSPPRDVSSHFSESFFKNSFGGGLQELVLDGFVLPFRKIQLLGEDACYLRGGLHAALFVKSLPTSLAPHTGSPIQLSLRRLRPPRELGGLGLEAGAPISSSLVSTRVPGACGIWRPRLTTLPTRDSYSPDTTAQPSTTKRPRAVLLRSASFTPLLPRGGFREDDGHSPEVVRRGDPPRP